MKTLRKIFSDEMEKNKLISEFMLEHHKMNTNDLSFSLIMWIRERDIKIDDGEIFEDFIKIIEQKIK